MSEKIEVTREISYFEVEMEVVKNYLEELLKKEYKRILQTFPYHKNNNYSLRECIQSAKNYGGFAKEAIDFIETLGERYNKNIDAYNHQSDCDFSKAAADFLADSDFAEKISSLLDSMGVATNLKEKRIPENEAINKKLQDHLLNCEKIRADIEPYDEKMLTDPNRGHWDLWESKTIAKKQKNPMHNSGGQNHDENEVTIDGDAWISEIEMPFFARNPSSDIKRNGVIAIDFGTKSTVVVYQDGTEHSLPMGIGDGNLKKELTKEQRAKRFENPTAIHFANLNRFLKAYNAKKGRPDTKWTQLTISHTATDQFNNAPSDKYFEFLTKLKQWAGEENNLCRIQIGGGESMNLPAFLDLKDGDLNPIELYAYYLGLYINNMRNKIYLNYYLSFPVTYTKTVRKKIVESFEKGIKKSLPESVLNNEAIMKNFKINGEISEPQAYAACALQEYRIEPKDDEEIFYGIFDFGGGTTDFDFGIWKLSDSDRYDYILANFGSGGDQYLGGENLLERLSFEVFKENQAAMRKDGFPFTKPHGCQEFLGSNELLSDSQEAEKNMHNMMERLREFWELQESDDGKIVGKKEIFKNANGFKVQESDDSKDFENDNGTDNSKTSETDAQNPANLQSQKEEHFEPQNSDNEIAKENNDSNNVSDSGENLQTDSAFFGVSDAEETLKIGVDLFDTKGNLKSQVKLDYSMEKINSFFVEEITKGVREFFSSFIQSRASINSSAANKLHILLAGNSCKSPLVKEIFKKEMENMKKRFEEQNTRVDFEMFPPLGTPDAAKKMKERGIPYDENDFEKPTGKTGVAFGLIQCRKGGKVKLDSHIPKESEIPFRYYLGLSKRNMFVIPRSIKSASTTQIGKPDYNVWYKFIDASDETFNLRYTTLPSCLEGDMPIDDNSKIKYIKCDIAPEDVDEDAWIYIKAISPDQIQYVVAASEDVENTKIGQTYTVKIEE